MKKRWVAELVVVRGNSKVLYMVIRHYPKSRVCYLKLMGGPESYRYAFEEDLEIPRLED